MASLALYARRFAADRFATFAGWQMGMGSIGTLLATAPLALSAAAVGWRATFVGMAIVMGIALVLVALVVREDGDTGAASVRQESFWQSLAGIRAACATDSVGLLFLAHMTAYSSFVLIAGLWGGPYLSHVYGLGSTERGTLLPAITQVVGMVIWGRADRLFGSYKAPVLIGAGTTCALLWFLALAGQRPLPALIATLAVFGFFAGYTPLVVAHGKSLFPPHLVGRGMTLLNMGSMGGVFVSQTVTGWAIDLFPAEAGVYPLASYRLVFALQAACLLATCIAYLWARDPSVHRRERATVK
jgi:MFS family permease